MDVRMEAARAWQDRVWREVKKEIQAGASHSALCYDERVRPVRLGF